MLENQPLSVSTMEARTQSGAPAPTGPTEVLPASKRRRHTTAYKLEVVKRAAALRSQGNGALGAYLRAEGLYYSAIRKWETLHAQGKLTGADRRGARQQGREVLQAENKQLRRQNEALQKRLRKTELIVDLQKKLSAVLQNETDEPSGTNDAP